MLTTTNESITVVIPTYNSEALVPERVTELQQRNFEKIVVCDDASTDNTINCLSKLYESSITIIEGKENLGPGGNRNRCIKYFDDSNTDGLILFIDADCRIVYDGDLSKLVYDSFSAADIGVVGFGILTTDGNPMRWNKGALMHPIHEAADTVLEKMLSLGQITKEQFMLGAPERASSFRMFPEANTEEVGWVSEACFAIRTSLFKQLGGFATAMRYHETHDLNARVVEANYKTLFCPKPVVQHLAHDSRFHRRVEDERSGRLYYYQKHWGMSEEVFKRLFDESDIGNSSF